MDDFGQRIDDRAELRRLRGNERAPLARDFELESGTELVYTWCSQIQYTQISFLQSSTGRGLTARHAM